MAKKETKKKAKRILQTPTLDIVKKLTGRIEVLEQRALAEDFSPQIKALNQRIDKIVNAISKAKSVKGL